MNKEELREHIRDQESDLKRRKEGDRFLQEIEGLEQFSKDPAAVLQSKLEQVKGNPLEADLKDLTPLQKKDLYQDPEFRQAHKQYILEKKEAKQNQHGPIDDLYKEHKLKMLERSIETNKKTLYAQPSNNPVRYAGYGADKAREKNEKIVKWLQDKGKIAVDRADALTPFE